MATAFWPYVHRIGIQFRDLDCMGHVNNAVYVGHLEQARNQCYLDLLGRRDPLDPAGGLDFVVARVEVDYLVPVHYPDALEIVIRPVSVGRSSFTLVYEVTREDRAVVLRARTVLVAYDWATRKSKQVSPELAEGLRAGIAA